MCVLSVFFAREGLDRVCDGALRGANEQQLAINRLRWVFSVTSAGQATVDPSLSDMLFDLAIKLEGPTNVPVADVARYRHLQRLARQGTMFVARSSGAPGNELDLEDKGHAMPTGRIVIIPFLHGKLAANGTLVEPDIDSILQNWLERHPEYRDKKYHVISPNELSSG
jgi:hypothetical protein